MSSTTGGFLWWAGIVKVPASFIPASLLKYETSSALYGNGGLGSWEAEAEILVVFYYSF